MRNARLSDGTSCPYCGDKTTGYETTRRMKQKVFVSFDGQEEILSQEKDKVVGDKKAKCRACKVTFRLKREWE